MQFKRSIGPLGLLFSAVSGILGSAWLFGPYYAAQLAGPASIIAWILGGMITIAIALTFAELVCMLPIPGGSARFIYFSHGTLASFFFNWIMWLGYAAVAPVETMAVLQYLSSKAPWLVMLKSGVTVLTLPGYGIAAALLFFLCWLNFFSIKWLSRYNSTIAWVKLIVPILVGIAIIATVFHTANFHHLHGFMPYGTKGITSAISLGGIMFAFAGFAPAIVLAGEAKNPQRTVPLVLVGALLVCLVVYLILEIGFIGAQSPTALQHGWSHLHFHHDSSPFVGLIQQLHLGWLGLLVLLTAIIAPLGTGLIFITTSSRVAHAMSENGYFPNMLKILSKRGVPTIAVALNFVIGMALFFPAPGWQGMVSFVIAAFVLSYAVGPISLLSLRKQLPNQHRPFYLPLPKLWAYLAFMFANFIVYWTGWHIYSEMLIAISLGIIVLLFTQHTAKTKLHMEWKAGWWMIVYILGLGVISLLGNIGGGLKILSTESSAIVIPLFSLLILIWAHHSRSCSKLVKQRIESEHY